MYNPGDPRASLPSARASTMPRPGQRSWHARGQNFLVAYTGAEAGALLARQAQPDGYAPIPPDAASSVVVSTPQADYPMPCPAP